jgi:hypothetical protein
MPRLPQFSISTKRCGLSAPPRVTRGNTVLAPSADQVPEEF